MSYPRAKAMPSDREICSMVSTMWHNSHNLEVGNIAACLASKMKVNATPEFREHVHARLKALVKSGDLCRQRFLPGRPYYTIR